MHKKNLLLNTSYWFRHFNFAMSGFLAGPNHLNIKSLWKDHVWSKGPHSGTTHWVEQEGFSHSFLCPPNASSQIRETVAARVPTMLSQSDDKWEIYSHNPHSMLNTSVCLLRSHAGNQLSDHTDPKWGRCWRTQPRRHWCQPYRAARGHSLLDTFFQPHGRKALFVFENKMKRVQENQTNSTNLA